MEIIKYFVLKDNKNAIKHNLWEAAKRHAYWEINNLNAYIRK